MAEKFERTRVSTAKERKLITLAITNTDFLRAMLPVCDAKYLKVEHLKYVWDWCREFYEDYGEAPGKRIQDIYMRKRDNMDPADHDLIGNLLQNLADNDEKSHDFRYDIDVASDYLTFNKAMLLSEEIKQACEVSDLMALNQALTEFKNVKAASAKAVDVLEDVDRIAAAFDLANEFLFKFDDGAFGAIVGPVKRGDFIAFQGFAKARKSWMLQHAAQTAEENGLNVLLVDLEMTESSRIQRIWRQIRRLPMQTEEVTIPIFYRDDPDDEDEKWKIQYHTEVREGIKATAENIREWQKERKMYYRGGGLRLLSLKPNSTTVDQLVSYMKSLELFEDFKVDVVVVDFPDKMKNDHREHRHGINQIWTGLRGAGLSERIAVFAASHSGRDAAEGESNASNISEDIRKVNEVTNLLSMSATPAERKAGLLRVKSEATREGKDYRDSVYVTNCLDIGCIALDSRYISECEIELETSKKKRRNKDEGTE